MASKSFEELHVYQLSEKLSDEIWNIVGGWNHFAKDTVGKQLVRAADSIGANIAEGSGRGAYQDNRRFVKIARGSLYEVRHWIRRASARDLLDSAQAQSVTILIDELAPKLNAYLRSIGPVPMTNDK
jgi:four helix bundle protein